MSKKIIITGGIASGKSTVIEALKQSIPEFEFFNFDDYTRSLYKLPEVEKFLIDHFGTTDRTIISDIVFSENAKRKALDNFFAPKIISALSVLLASQDDIIIEMPLFHSLWYSHYNGHIRSLWTDECKVITVGCDDNVRVNRIVKRNGFDKQKAWAIINSQLSLEQQLQFTNLFVDTQREVNYNKLSKFIRG